MITLSYENKVQEAIEKWLKSKDNPKIKLHMIGKLQTNKVKFAVKFLTIYIPLIVLSLLKKLQQNKKLINIKIFIQVNLANEIQNLV